MVIRSFCIFFFLEKTKAIKHRPQWINDWWMERTVGENTSSSLCLCHSINELKKKNENEITQRTNIVSYFFVIYLQCDR